MYTFDIRLTFIVITRLRRWTKTYRVGRKSLAAVSLPSIARFSFAVPGLRFAFACAFCIFVWFAFVFHSMLNMEIIPKSRTKKKKRMADPAIAKEIHHKHEHAESSLTLKYSGMASVQFMCHRRQHRYSSCT